MKRLGTIFLFISALCLFLSCSDEKDNQTNRRLEYEFHNGVVFAHSALCEVYESVDYYYNKVVIQHNTINGVSLIKNDDQTPAKMTINYNKVSQNNTLFTGDIIVDFIDTNPSNHQITVTFNGFKMFNIINDQSFSLSGGFLFQNFIANSGRLVDSADLSSQNLILSDDYDNQVLYLPNGKFTVDQSSIDFDGQASGIFQQNQYGDFKNETYIAHFSHLRFMQGPLFTAGKISYTTKKLGTFDVRYSYPSYGYVTITSNDGSQFTYSQ